MSPVWVFPGVSVCLDSLVGLLGWRVVGGRARAQGDVSMSGRVGLLLCAVLLTVVGVDGVTAEGSERRSSAAGPVVTEAADERSAKAAAVASGGRVEVLDQRTETGRVFANPSGTVTLEQHSLPVRTRQDGRWVDIDTTLRMVGGRVVPVASAAEVALSAGGSSPLVVLGREGKQLSLSWPGNLPVPDLAGDTATYRDVLAGVDVQMRAESTGARLLVVVKDRVAAANPALRSLSFRYTTKDLELRRDAAAGSVSAVDSGGRVVFGAGTALMWDSGDQPDVGEAGVGQRARKLAAMPVAVSSGELTVVPDQNLLTGADTAYPVMVDPWFTAGAWAWTYVNRKFPDQSYWSYGREVGSNAGFEATDNTTQRSYFRMGTGALNGKDIISAQFRVNLWGGWSCTQREVQLWAGGDIGPGTTWNNQPWRRYIGSLTAAKRSGGTGTCAPGVVEFNALSAVSEATSNGYAHTVLSLQAPEQAENNQDPFFWKKFSPDPQLVIEYNTAPNVPADLYADINLPCATGGGRPVTNTSPTLFATGADVDGGNVEVEFEWYHHGGSKIGSYRHPFVATGSRFSAVVPVAALQDGNVYTWRARSGDGRVWGPWSGSCEFAVDTTRPTAIPVVSSAAFPENDLGIPAGSRGEFTFTSADPDVHGYRYRLAEGTTYFIPAGPGTGRLASVPVTATTSRPQTMYVYSVDRAGNRSDTYRAYPFYPDEPVPPPPPVRHDVNADALADVTAVRQVDADETAFLTFVSTGQSVYAPSHTWESGPNTNFRADRIKTGVGDFNGDGRSDLVVLRDEGGNRLTLWLFYANGIGYDIPTVPAWDSGPGSWDLNRVKPVTGDFNGDGKDDVAAVYNYDSPHIGMWAFLGTGTGIAAPTMWWQTPAAGWADWNRMKVVAGDFDGDGDSDVAHFYSYPDEQTRLWIHYSSGLAFGAGTEAWNSGPFQWDWNRMKPVVADSNGDGKDDVIAFYEYYNANFRIWIFTGTTTGVQAPTTWFTGPAGWADWSRMKIVAGDFDGDGRDDVAHLYRYPNNRTALWAHTSTGTAFGAGALRWDSGDWGLDWDRTTFH
ncbi:FG-GAP-like repeat-containing protein [Actinokineospora sp.]|uniref:FG-GAP-like repeat-containing protein n=1 Tax=Actinokineospora sp. TaxID=1872133 RepID=UPI004037A480